MLLPNITGLEQPTMEVEKNSSGQGDGFSESSPMLQANEIQKPVDNSADRDQAAQETPVIQTTAEVVNGNSPVLITLADVQKSSNGTLLSYLEDEADRDPALTLARVAMGESGNLEERYRIMWVTIIRSALGFKDNRERGWFDSPVDQFYTTPTGIKREVLEPGEFQYSPIEVAVYMNITNPETEATGNLKAMLYPSGDLEDAFRSTYNYARALPQYQYSPDSLKNLYNPFLNQVKGYEHFAAVSTNEGGGPQWNWSPYGLYTQVFAANQHEWSDRLPMDNVFFGLATCKQVKEVDAYERAEMPRENWMVAGYFPRNENIVCLP